ncbi:MAG: polypeptide subunit release factor methylase [Planctomycetota bacterium]|jgi:methylase of polypeptide subunit release factors
MSGLGGNQVPTAGISRVRHSFVVDQQQGVRLGMDAPYSVAMISLPDGRKANLITESGQAEPAGLMLIDESTSTEGVLELINAGRSVVWGGDFRNGRQLLSELKSRLKSSSREEAAPDLLTRWRQQRAATKAQGELFERVMVVLEAGGQVALRRAPDTRVAVDLAWGEAKSPRVVALNTLLGALSAAEWTRKGLTVPGLSGQLIPGFGVFSPTRNAYVNLLEHLEVDGKTVMDVGCGTGVLAFVLLQRGASSAIGTDIEPRAVASARQNSELLALNDRFKAVEADLFPEGELADCIVFNAPWMPETPRTRLDSAVFDEEGSTLRRFIAALPDQLTEDGFAALLISDLPERLGMRTPDHVERIATEAGMQVMNTFETPAVHKRTQDSSDPLHLARAAERIKMHVMKRVAKE